MKYLPHSSYSINIGGVGKTERLLTHSVEFFNFSFILVSGSLYFFIPSFFFLRLYVFIEFHSCQSSRQLHFWWFWVMAVLHFTCNVDEAGQDRELSLPRLPSWAAVSVPLRVKIPAQEPWTSYRVCYWQCYWSSNTATIVRVILNIAMLFGKEDSPLGRWEMQICNGSPRRFHF